MDEGEITNYIDYWMESDANFSSILGDPNNIVEDVEHIDYGGVPRTSVFMNHSSLILLFPPFQTGIDYTQINYHKI